ncbi:MAG: hypothetical protein ACRDNK_08870 [Solirubrobacteraceae bacterium]
MAVTVPENRQEATEPRSALGRLRMAGLTWMGVAAVTTVIGVAERWPAQFGGAGQPSKIATQWMSKGTVLSPPLFMIVALALALAVAELVKARSAKIVAGAIAALVGAIGTVFTIGEAATAATPAVPTGAHLGAFVGAALSLWVLAAALWFLRSAR